MRVFEYVFIVVNTQVFVVNTHEYPYVGVFMGIHGIHEEPGSEVQRELGGANSSERN